MVVDTAQDRRQLLDELETLRRDLGEQAAQYLDPQRIPTLNDVVPRPAAPADTPVHRRNGNRDHGLSLQRDAVTIPRFSLSNVRIDDEAGEPACLDDSEITKEITQEAAAKRAADKETADEALEAMITDSKAEPVEEASVEPVEPVPSAPLSCEPERTEPVSFAKDEPAETLPDREALIQEVLESLQPQIEATLRQRLSALSPQQLQHLLPR